MNDRRIRANASIRDAAPGLSTFKYEVPDLEQTYHAELELAPGNRYGLGMVAVLLGGVVIIAAFPKKGRGQSPDLCSSVMPVVLRRDLDEQRCSGVDFQVEVQPVLHSDPYSL